MADFKFDVLSDFGILEEGPVFDIRAKIISWNGGPPKLDIRKWNKETNNMSKGISISLDSIEQLKNILDAVEPSYELPNDDNINM